MILRYAIALLKAGYPLSLDLTTRLLSEGVDVAALESKYA